MTSLIEEVRVHLTSYIYLYIYLFQNDDISRTLERIESKQSYYTTLVISHVTIQAKMTNIMN